MAKLKKKIQEANTSSLYSIKKTKSPFINLTSVFPNRCKDQTGANRQEKESKVPCRELGALERKAAM